MHFEEVICFFVCWFLEFLKFIFKYRNLQEENFNMQLFNVIAWNGEHCPNWKTFFNTNTNRTLLKKSTHFTHIFLLFLLMHQKGWTRLLVLFFLFSFFFFQNGLSSMKIKLLHQWSLFLISHRIPALPNIMFGCSKGQKYHLLPFNLYSEAKYPTEYIFFIIWFTIYERTNLPTDKPISVIRGDNMVCMWEQAQRIKE